MGFKQFSVKLKKNFFVCMKISADTWKALGERNSRTKKIISQGSEKLTG